MCISILTVATAGDLDSITEKNGSVGSACAKKCRICMLDFICTYVFVMCLPLFAWFLFPSWHYRIFLLFSRFCKCVCLHSLSFSYDTTPLSNHLWLHDFQFFTSSPSVLMEFNLPAYAWILTQVINIYLFNSIFITPKIHSGYFVLVCLLLSCGKSWLSQ